MLKKCILTLCMAFLFLFSLSGCARQEKPARIGVSMGVGSAARWPQEAAFMEARAKEVGAEIEIRINKTDEPKTQQQDCIEMIDSGIEVLILTARDVTKAGEILEYAKKKKVPVISYARVIIGDQIDLYVGYDSNRIGQRQGQYLTELVPSGNYILLRGDKGDYNSQLVYAGAWRYLEEIQDNINIILDSNVPEWSVDETKKMVKEAITANDNKIDAILAPNDKLAGACAEVLKELEITNPVIITGMDAELDAAKRILDGTQGCTIYMDLKLLANLAVDEAVLLANHKKADVNAEFDNQSGETIDANLITGQLVTKENLDKVLIDSGYLTHEEVYGN